MESSSNLSTLADEELVALAKKADGGKAKELLILRHREWPECLLAHLGQSLHLALEDRLDAQQQAIFLLREAVRRFDPERVRAQAENPFQVYLVRIARKRMADFARRIRRHRKHSGQSLGAAQLLDSQTYELPGLVGSAKPSSRVGQDPAHLAQAHEQQERLAAALEKLPDGDRRLWEALWNRATIPMIAKQFGVSYAVAMHPRQNLIAHLREAVKDKCE